MPLVVAHLQHEGAVRNAHNAHPVIPAVHDENIPRVADGNAEGLKKRPRKSIGRSKPGGGDPEAEPLRCHPRARIHGVDTVVVDICDPNDTVCGDVNPAGSASKPTRERRRGPGGDQNAEEFIIQYVQVLTVRADRTALRI
jgi:hypothetical protein